MIQKAFEGQLEGWEGRLRIVKREKEREREGRGKSKEGRNNSHQHSLVVSHGR